MVNVSLYKREDINYESNYDCLVPEPGLNGAEHEGTSGYNHVIN